MADITVRYASTDQDVVAIHQFLVVVAGPRLPWPIDPKKSATEVWRVVNHDVSLMAIVDDRLIGTIGLVRPEFWWGNTFFLASRWYFCLPGSQAWLPLLREAKKIAVASDLELHIISEERGKIAIINRHKNRRTQS